MFPLLISTPPPRINTFRVEQVSWDNLAGRKLRDQQVAEISARFGTPPENAPGIPPSVDNITLFLLAFPENSDDPVACGAIRHLEDGFMEASQTIPTRSPGNPLNPIWIKIKRMYATPKSRGTGAALCVLLALEKYARSLGVKGLKLETATLQPDAIR